MTRFTRNHWLTLAAFALMITATLYAWPRLEAPLPVHWGLSGEPDRYGSKLEALLLVPGLSLLVWGLLAGLARFDRNAEKNRVVLRVSQHAVVLSMAALHLGIVASYLGWELSVMRLVNLTVGVMLLLVGNVLPKAQPSRFVGVRLPWTFDSRKAWHRAQRLGGWVLSLTGAALIVASLVTGQGLVFLAILVLMALALVGVSIDAYRVWRDDPDRERAR